MIETVKRIDFEFNHMESTTNRYLNTNLGGQLLDFLGSKWASRAVSLGLCAVAGLLIWSLLSHQARLGTADANSFVFKARPDTKAMTDHVAGAHLFGQSPSDAVNAGPAVAVNTNVTLEGIFYSADPELARAILDVDGKGEIYKTGDSLPDGEKLAEISTLAVRLSNGGSTREVALPEHWGGLAGGIQLAGAGNLNPDLFPGSESLAASGPGSSPRLQPVSIPTGRDPIAQMQALRQQLIKH